MIFRSNRIIIIIKVKVSTNKKAGKLFTNMNDKFINTPKAKVL